MSIFASIVEIATAFLSALIELFPNANPNVTTFISSTYTNINDFLSTGNYFFPMTFLVQVAPIMIIMELALYTTKVTVFIYKHIVPKFG